MVTPGSPQTAVLASGNDGKLREFNRLLAPLDMQLQPQSAFQVPEVAEDGLSFVENAIIKARAAAKHTGLPALADDSGLEVDYLQGAPGIYSARYAGSSGSGADARNNSKLLSELEGVPPDRRTARFLCVLVYMRHWQDPTPLICQGSWEGQILLAPRGANGFGYDPLFYLTEYDCSSAELDPGEKNRISHRAQASQKLLDALKGR
ncbi:MAG: RdgB/HAM1 family non-canonical purine NTP pyrophosphatase [Halioglobus sp.]